MKKIFFIALFMFAIMFSFITNSYASDKVKVYLFGFDECPHCAREYEYLKSLDGYNKKFEVVKKPIYDENMKQTTNFKLALKVAEHFEKNGISNSEFIGSPYVVISDLYAASGYSEDVVSYIDDAYNNGDKDIVSTIENTECLDCEDDTEIEDTTSTTTDNEYKNTNKKTTTSNKENKFNKLIILYSSITIAFVTAAIIYIFKRK